MKDKNGGRLLALEGSHSGLVRTLGKRVCRKIPWVQIPPPPPEKRPASSFDYAQDKGFKRQEN